MWRYENCTQVKPGAYQIVAGWWYTSQGLVAPQW